MGLRLGLLVLVGGVPATCVPPGFAAEADGGEDAQTASGQSESATMAARKNLDRPWAHVLAKITKTPFAPNGNSVRVGRQLPPISGV